MSCVLSGRERLFPTREPPKRLVEARPHCVAAERPGGVCVVHDEESFTGVSRDLNLPGPEFRVLALTMTQSASFGLSRRIQ